MVGCGATGIELNRSEDFPFGISPAPVLNQLDRPDEEMRVRKIIVERQRFSGVYLFFPTPLGGPVLKRQSQIGASVTWIHLDRLLVVCNGSVEMFGCSLLHTLLIR